MTTRVVLLLLLFAVSGTAYGEDVGTVAARRLTAQLATLEDAAEPELAGARNEALLIYAEVERAIAPAPAPFDEIVARFAPHVEALKTAHGNRMRRAAAALRAEIERVLPPTYLPRTETIEPPVVTASAGRRRAVTPPSSDPAIIGVPRQADYEATSEAAIHDDIRSLAEQLGRDPRRMYEYVREKTRVEPYFGSRKGALLTLWEEGGSAIDAASLLIALFRASGYAARYVRGTSVLTEAQAKAWLGVADMVTAERILRAGFVPVSKLANGSLLIEHMWVAVYLAGSGPRWTLLDPSFKEVRVVTPATLPADLLVAPDELMRAVKNSGALDTASRRLLRLPRLPSASAPDAIDSDADLLRTHLARSTTAATTYLSDRAVTGNELFGHVAIVAGASHEFPPSLALTPISSTSFAALPSDLNATLMVEVWDSARKQRSLTYSATMAELAGKRITLMYVAATAFDQSLIDRYGALMLTPPSVNLTPVLYVAGKEVARGVNVFMGTAQLRRIGVRYPPGGGFTSENQLRAGDTIAVGLDYGRTSVKSYTTSIDRLTAERARLPKKTNGFPSIASAQMFREPVAGEMLHAMIQAYFAQNDAYRDILAHRLDVTWFRNPSFGVAMMPIAFDTIFGAVYGTRGVSLGFDVGADNARSFSRRGDAARAYQFQKLHGVYSSALEHSLWESLGVGALSTIRLLTSAMERGVPIYHIDSTNRSMLSRLNLNTTAEAHITSYLDQGFEVVAHERDLTIGEWQGAGYIVRHPTTGAFGYWIAGGLQGGNITIAEGGAIIHALKVVGAVGWTLWSLRGDFQTILLGGALFTTGGPVGVGGGLLLGVAGTKAAGDDVVIIMELLDGRKDPDAYFIEEVQEYTVDKFILGKAGTVLKRELEAVLPLSERYIDEIVDAAKDSGKDVGEYVELTLKRLLGSSASVNAAPPMRELMTLMLVDKSPQTWQALVALQKAHSWDLCDALLRNEFLLDQRAIGAVATAILEAPAGEGLAQLRAVAASADSFHTAYVLRSAKKAGGTIQYAPKVEVTYTPITGLTVGGQPIDGTATKENVAFDFTSNGRFFAVLHVPTRANDVRVWNLVRKTQAATATPTPATTALLWLAGTVDNGMSVWATLNARNVTISANRADSFE